MAVIKILTEESAPKHSNKSPLWAETPTARTTPPSPRCVFVADVNEQLDRPLVAASFRRRRRRRRRPLKLIIIYALISAVCHQKRPTHTLYCVHRADYPLWVCLSGQLSLMGGPSCGEMGSASCLFSLSFLFLSIPSRSLVSLAPPPPPPLVTLRERASERAAAAAAAAIILMSAARKVDLRRG